MSAAWKRAHPGATAMQRKRYHQRIRAAAIMAYGGECVECGEKLLDRLELDHEDGGGNKERDAIFGHGHRSPGGWNYALWLHKQGYPRDLGLVVRCKDCHDRKHGRGEYAKAPEPERVERPVYAIAGTEADAIY